MSLASHRRLFRMVAAMAAGVLTASLLVGVQPAEAATSKAPTSVKVTAAAATTVRLSWKAVSKATRYRVKYDDNKAMKSPQYARTTSAGIELTGLKPNTTYWATVVVTNAKDATLSPFSKKISFKTKAKALTLYAPTSVRAISTSNTAIRAAWAQVPGAVRYRVRWATKASMSGAKSTTTSVNSADLPKLKASTTYYVQVRATDAASRDLSDWSSAAKLKTKAKTGYPLLAPTGLGTADLTSVSGSFGWTASGPADRYRLRYATSASFSKPKTTTVAGAAATIEGLQPKTTYYLQARLIDAKNKDLSDWSGTLSFTTPQIVIGAPPSGLQVTAATPSSLTLAWTGIPGAPGYRVKYDTNASWKTPKYAFTTGTSVTLTGLLTNTTYSLKIRVMAPNGDFLTDYGATIKATTPLVPTTNPGTPPPVADPNALVVGSYNVRCHNCNSGIAEEKPWTTRRDAVISTIQQQNPDVIGLQEAQQSWLIDAATGKTINKSQFEDLVERLGEPWALTNPARNNCVKSTTPTDCVYKDQEASKGTKIIYRKDRLTLAQSGTDMLPSLTPSSYERYVAWAIFTQQSTGKQFFFANTHLEPDNDTAGQTTFHDQRARQAAAAADIIARLNPGLPVVLVGDLASSRADVPTNAPYDVLTTRGYLDPLGNVKGTSTPVNPTVGTRINTNFYSFNGWARLARKTTAQVNGIYNDYVLVTGSVQTLEYENVVNVDDAGRFIGVIPSDHNLIRATLLLP